MIKTFEELNYNDIRLIGHIYGDFKAIEYLKEKKKEKGSTLKFYITKKDCEIIL